MIRITNAALRGGVTMTLALAGSPQAWSDGSSVVGVVDVLDLLAVVLAWGQTGPADVSGDGSIDTVDLVQVILEWGRCG